MSTQSIRESVAKAIERARVAQAEAESWNQSRVDDVVAAVGWQCYREENARRIARISREETRLGDAEHLYALQRKRVLGILHDLHGETTVGVVEELPHLGLRKIAKPIGVIAAASPATAPGPGLICNALPMLKTRNAVVFTPNPRARASAEATVDLIRAALEEAGAPADLVQCLDAGGREAAQELMAAADLVVAVGGQGTVRRAYLSGTPAIGAGVGNPTVIVDETSDFREAARRIQWGASYNNGTSCSSESNVLVHRSIADEFRAELIRSGAHVCTRAETQELRNVLWPVGENLNRDLIGQSADVIAAAAGITLEAPEKTTALVLACDDPRGDSPILLEKLSPVVTLCVYDDFAHAVESLKLVEDRCGRGHSCGIYSENPDRVAYLADRIPTCRVVVNQSTMTNTGSFENGVPFTTTLSSGSWGGCSMSGNVTWRQYVNHTTVSWPIEERRVDEALIFGRHWASVDLQASR
ncbi:aldehyde dehydrogenase family protein [Streptomyces sp. NPDC013489]|uniref:aldehyde dehydrogenase family protein n=1 Tax=Streptomyces sp. NPDC013489 TaxID=3155606 RepID=UPI0033D4C6E3